MTGAVKQNNSQPSDTDEPVRSKTYQMSVVRVIASPSTDRLNPSQN
jgi:hypothetical protein